MKKAYRLVTLLILSALTPLAGGAEEQFSAQTEVSKTSLTIGDPFEYALILKYSPDIQVDSLDPREKLGKFEIRDSSLVTENKNKLTVRRYNFTLVPWQVGNFEISALAVGYKDKEGNAKKVFSDPVKLEVKTVLGEVTDTTNIKGLKAQLALGRSLWFYVAAVLTLIGIAAAVLYFYKRRKKPEIRPEIIRPAWEFALEDLQNLKEALRQGRVQYREYYFRLSEVLRGYLEKRFRIPLLESTTQEIRLRLQEDFLNVSSKDAFLKFLEQSDLIKFAKVVPENKMLEEDWQLAYRIVSETIPKPEPVLNFEKVKV
jgi:hypothetical protein